MPFKEQLNCDPQYRKRRTNGVTNGSIECQTFILITFNASCSKESIIALCDSFHTVFLVFLKQNCTLWHKHCERKFAL